MKARFARLSSAAMVALAPQLVLADEIAEARAEIEAVARDAANVSAGAAAAKPAKPSVELRLASAELIYRSKDYARAAIAFGELVDEAPGTATEAEARYWRGEAFYATQKYISARRDYRVIVERASEPHFSSHASQALARLVDISIKLNDFDGLDALFSRIGQLPQSDAAVQYARGKALYARGDYSQADAVLAQVAAPYTHQAAYFQGLAAMRQAPTVTTPPAAEGGEVTPKIDYRNAIERFRKVTTLKADTPDQQHIVDLAWLAIGRLNYEAGLFKQAEAAYKKVDRNSREFETSLYELAWVYVRLSDIPRAERALEVLTISDPDSQELGEGSLLRADLLLRSGSFRRAESLYQSVKDTYEPTYEKVAERLSTENDPGALYDRLTDANSQGVTDLPPLARRWARESDEATRAFVIIDDVQECRRLIKESYDLAERLEAALRGDNRARAFPELQAGQQQALGLLNRLAKTRASLAQSLEREQTGAAVASLRDERRRLATQLAKAPVAPADFAARDRSSQQQWGKLEQGLAQRQREIDELGARLSGLRYFLKEEAKITKGRSTRTAGDSQQLRGEVDEVEAELSERRLELERLRKSVEFGRSQVGLGDAPYLADAEARARFRQVFAEETQLSAQGQAGAKAQKLAGELGPVLARLDAEEDKLQAALARFDAEVVARAQELGAQIDAERDKISGYEQKLAELDGEARGLVGEVAQRNFAQVLAKLDALVVRADVGLTEHAWELREEEMYRVRLLQTERAQQENALEEELQEVLDEASEPTVAPGAKK